MPYIKPEDRKILADGAAPDNAGELNYTLTKILLNYLQKKGKSYGVINEIIGVVNCVGLEFYRRHAAPYEDEKIIENGDVLPDPQ